MNRLRIYGVLITTLLMLNACSSSDVPSQPVPDPTPTNTATPLASTIGYHYTGGIAGLRKEMTIAPGGITTLYDRGKIAGTLKLSPERMANLVRLFEEADFYNLKENYEDKDYIIADDTYSTLTLTQGDRTKSVTVAMARGSDLAPMELMEIVSELSKMAWEIEKSATPSP